jgi:hypothetical protein
MGFVVIRRFRSGEGPAASRSFPREKEAREAARAWADEGWEVDFLATAKRERQTVRLNRTPRMPERPSLDLG